MHEAVAHSAVSDALVNFATAPVPAQAASAIAAARRAIAEARVTLARADDVKRRFDSLLQPDQAAPDDARIRAWTLGAVLAAQGGPSIATPVVAAAMAFGDKLSASDEEIAAAAAIGIEAAARVLAALDSGEYRVRWNLSSSIGVLGATLAVGRLLRLDESRARHALGIAATQASGLARNAAESMEAIEVGKAAADAIEAALMARHGFTSAPASIDGRRGLAALMAYRFDAAAIIDGLGSRWTATV